MEKCKAKVETLRINLGTRASSEGELNMEIQSTECFLKGRLHFLGNALKACCHPMSYHCATLQTLL